MMGTSFVGKVIDVRQIAETHIGEGVADMMESKAQINGHEATEKANRIQAWQGLLDWQLADRFDRGRPVLSYLIFHLDSNKQHFFSSPTLTRLLVEWAARARVRECRMVAKVDTPSVVQAMCKVRDRQGVW